MGKPPLRFVPWFVLATWAEGRSAVRNEGQGRLVRAATELAPWEFRRAPVGRAISWAGVEELHEASRQLLFGASKYDDWNWALGMPWTVPSECAKRHFVKAIETSGSDDEESGVTHSGAFWCNLVMLVHLCEHYPEGDDRPGADGKKIPYLSEERQQELDIAKAQLDAINNAARFGLGAYYKNALGEVQSVNPLNYFRK